MSAKGEKLTMVKRTDLDISSLEKAISSIEEALEEQKRSPKNNFVRDACIQRFEYTYELSHKMLRRFLKVTEANADDIEQMSFPDLIRTGASRGLLKNSWDVWKDYREARNLTSHTYNEKAAKEVCAIIPNFFGDAQFLYSELIRRIQAS